VSGTRRDLPIGSSTLTPMTHAKLFVARMHHSLLPGFLIALLTLVSALPAGASVNFSAISFSEALKLAKKEKKKIMVDYYTDWCRWCKVLDQKTYSDENVGKLSNARFIALKINAEQGEGIDLAKKYEVQGFPTIVFYDADGNEIDRVVGFQEPRKFVTSLKVADAGGMKGLERLVTTKAGKNDAALWLSLAERYAESPETQKKALAAYERVMTLDPKNKLQAKEEAMFGKGFLLQGEEQRKLLETAYRQYPHRQEARQVFQKFLEMEMHEGTEALALARMEEWVRSHADDGDVMNTFAWLAAQRSLLLDDAEQYAVKAVALAHDHTDRASVLDTRAEILYKKGKYSEAIEVEKEALSLLDPEKDKRLKRELELQLAKFESAKAGRPEGRLLEKGQGN
jgi:thioredoxin-related protein